MSNVCVAHLIWKPLGIEVFTNFLNSYQVNPAGLTHDLIIIFNGFNSEEDINEYKRLLYNCKYKLLFIKEPVQDIEAYFKVIKQFRYKYYCFLNSYCIILDNNWLLKMYRYVSKDDVGLVGATVSFEKCGKKSSFGRILKKINITKLGTYLDPFPNYHIRTSSFMISREIISRICYKIVRNKLDAYKFESGSNSLTNQILKISLQPIVVGKDGKGYKKEEWCESNIYRQDQQNNLLISDNRTREYLEASTIVQRKLAQYAWRNQDKNFNIILKIKYGLY